MVVVKYKYDAWGNHAVLNADGTDCESGIGVLNPFRYRGYYYDTETGLYFLQTRYYDPEAGRFISRDSIEYATPETINGLNLYAYCGNNPLRYTDPNGNFIGWLVVAVVFGVATRVVGSEIRTGYNKTIDEFNYYGLGTFESGGGINASTNSNTPITFYLNVPDKWWRFWEYGVGVDISINEYGASLTLSPQGINLSVKLKDGSHSVGLTSLRRLYYEQRVYVTDNSYFYERFSLNIPEIAVLVLIFVYAAQAIPALLIALAGVAA